MRLYRVLNIKNSFVDYCGGRAPQVNTFDHQSRTHSSPNSSIVARVQSLNVPL